MTCHMFRTLDTSLYKIIFPDDDLWRPLIIVFLKHRVEDVEEDVDMVRLEDEGRSEAKGASPIAARMHSCKQDHIGSLVLSFKA